MAFNTDKNLSRETIDLLSKYSNFNEWWEVNKRRKIKKEAYAIELPKIKEKLSYITDFDELLKETDSFRRYTETLYIAVSDKKISLNRLTQTMLGNSIYSHFVRTKLKLMYYCLAHANVSCIITEKVVRTVHSVHQGYFEEITETNLDIFAYFQSLDRKRHRN